MVQLPNDPMRINLRPDAPSLTEWEDFQVKGIHSVVQCQDIECLWTGFYVQTFLEAKAGFCPRCGAKVKVIAKQQGAAAG